MTYLFTTLITVDSGEILGQDPVGSCMTFEDPKCISQHKTFEDAK